MFATRVPYPTERGPATTNLRFMMLYLPGIAICHIKSRFSGKKIHGCKPKTASTNARLCIKTPEENTASWMLSFHWLHTEKTKKKIAGVQLFLLKLGTTRFFLGGGRGLELDSSPKKKSHLRWLRAARSWCWKMLRCWVAQGRLESAIVSKNIYDTQSCLYRLDIKKPPTQYLKLVTTRTMIFWVTKSQNETFTWHCRVLMGEDPIHIGDDFVWKKNGATLKFGVLTSQKSLNLTTMLTHPKPQSRRKNLVGPVLWGCRIGCCSTFSLIFSAADDYFRIHFRWIQSFTMSLPGSLRGGYPWKLGLNAPKWKASY